VDHYSLAPRVYMCIPTSSAVLLDVKRDAYYGLDPKQTRLLRMLITDERAALEAGEYADFHSDDLDSFAKELVRGGFLQPRTTATLARQISAVLPPVDEAIFDPQQPTPTAISLHHVLCFFYSYISTAFTFRLRSLSHTLDDLGRQPAGDATNTDIESVRRLTNVFSTLRPFAYASRDRCLFDSLALLSFLRRYRMRAHLVIGVRTAPFAAHSWVQFDKYVLNGTANYTRWFTPIVIT